MRRRDAGLVGVDALEAGAVGTIGDVDRSQPLDDLRRHAEGAPGDGAAIARGHRAVGIVAVAGGLGAADGPDGMRVGDTTAGVGHTYDFTGF